MRIAHIGLHTPGNAGDTLLFIMVRDLFNRFFDSIIWDLIELHQPVDNEVIERINNNDAVIIGGGGLFLKDTNRNENSGWQWNCSLDCLCSIKVPIILFGIGYNRFRNQPEFIPVFKKHINAIARRSVFFGMRNNGSVKKTRQYLLPSLQSQISFQPCPTTLITKMYGGAPVKFRKHLTFNLAFDRESLRYGNKKEPISRQIASVMRYYSRRKWEIEVITHCPNDGEITDYINSQYSLSRLCYQSPETIIKHYRNIPITIGMRGHAQLIPFGCGNPIISLISHDKLVYFLEDIRHPEWGIEINKINKGLLKKIHKIVNNYDIIQRNIEEAKNRFWEVTKTNMEKIRRTLDA